MSQVTTALAAEAILGECPRWHAEESRLYWVDIAQNRLHRFDPASGQDDVRTFDAPVGCFAFVRGGGLLLGMKDGLAMLSGWDATPVPFGEQILAGRPDLRLNDGRTDNRGRFWAGSVNMAKSAEDAALYRFDPDGRATLMQDGMLTCNGAAFSADGLRFHHADTPSHALRTYRADPQAGTLHDEHVLHQFPHGQGRPDGGSFDEAGFYWSALFDGGRVVRIAPSGEVVESIALPVPRPTMIAFGGTDRRTAYVTSARSGLDAGALAAAPLSGAILSFRVDVPGVAEWDFG
ncbi:SMP-30/gluconolactonase/LRE family protein [Sphingobium sufflavum]|uniref:SMP-30/gluconolactonase/LRE family protein n=1 Tax=Sphingobium sufflavum TaxID=1129547 RepID=UPI001F3AF966|nr:SMP-30/gluconolactonase/LRE family protein [Sphingobium sufflavum]MCE7795232.1 SMP-30/gluconolactonase/LRE family protein [Sphingobium sufflavum]